MTKSQQDQDAAAAASASITPAQVTAWKVAHLKLTPAQWDAAWKKDYPGKLIPAQVMS
jgi:hypothetical protein